jgi:hypothetical protein
MAPTVIFLEENKERPILLTELLKNEPNNFFHTLQEKTSSKVLQTQCQVIRYMDMR